jgi:hypothetical protein
MAQGLSQNWRKDGPSSRVAQARFVTAQRQSVCVQAPPQSFCPVHFYRNCPVKAV